MPPSIDQWIQIPRLGAFVLETAWPYVVLPIDVIIGLELIKSIMSAIRQFRDLSD